jgi:hypothetical protein
MGFADFPASEEMVQNKFYEANGGFDLNQMAEDDY